MLSPVTFGRVTTAPRFGATSPRPTLDQVKGNKEAIDFLTGVLMLQSSEKTRPVAPRMFSFTGSDKAAREKVLDAFLKDAKLPVTRLDLLKLGKEWKYSTVGYFADQVRQAFSQLKDNPGIIVIDSLPEGEDWQGTRGQAVNQILSEYEDAAKKPITIILNTPTVTDGAVLRRAHSLAITA